MKLMVERSSPHLHVEEAASKSIRIKGKRRQCSKTSRPSAWIWKMQVLGPLNVSLSLMILTLRNDNALFSKVKLSTAHAGKHGQAADIDIWGVSRLPP